MNDPAQSADSMSEREAWLNIVKPAELDMHMASIGQAETNAAMVKEMFSRFPLGENARLLIHGCGSCQMFDYLSIPDIGNIELTFADFSPAMLEVGRKRLTRLPDARYNILVDDIERSTLEGCYDAVLLVLVLLHVNWRRSLENMIHLSPSRLYIIEQEQTPGVSPVTMKGKLLPSIERYSEVADMNLVPQQDLIGFTGMRGYSQSWVLSRPVPGDKTMVGFVFQRS
jgi:hypothetical protein